MDCILHRQSCIWVLLWPTWETCCPPSHENIHYRSQRSSWVSWTKQWEFLLNVRLCFASRTKAYTSDSSKMYFMVELLTRHALKWAQAVLKARPDLSYNDFLAKFCCLAKAWARMQLNTKCSTFGKVREAWLISQLTFGYWQRTWGWERMDFPQKPQWGSEMGIIPQRIA